MKVNLYLTFIIFLFLGCVTEQNLQIPEISIDEVTKIDMNYAEVSGKIIFLGDFKIVDHGFVWARESTPTIEDNWLSLGETDKPEAFKGILEDLDSNTTYYVRAFVEYGDGEVLYGNKVSLKTLDANTWVEKKEFVGGYLTGAASFVVSDTLYIGTGIHNTYTNGFYKYDYSQNKWSSVSALPSEERGNTISFSIRDYGYVGLGVNCTGSGTCSHSYFKDLWRYNPQNDRWTRMSDFPGTGRSHSTSFVIGDKAYVTGGSSVGDNDLWEYDSITDTWTKMADYPGGCSTRGISFSINGKGFVGLGWNGFSPHTCDDLWEFDPGNNVWTQKASLPGKARYDAIAYTINMTGFVACGVIQKDGEREYLTDMWSYNPQDNTWAPIENDYKGIGRVNMIGETINNRAIIGLGATDVLNGLYERASDIWEYIPKERN